MKHSTTWWEILGTVIAIFISFYALIKAGEELPVGTAYAVFVGLGSAGTIVTDHFIPHTIGHRKVLFLLLLLIGIIGFKMVTGNKERKQDELVILSYCRLF